MSTINDQRFHHAGRAESLMGILSSMYGVKDEGLLVAIAALGEAAAACGELLSNTPVFHERKHAGTQNASGDDQLVLDIECDKAVFEAIEKCGVYAMACSEETPVETPIKTSPVVSADMQQYTIGFDPLDGSSIIDANFAIGGIYGLWKSKTGLMGLTGRDQIASAVSMFGPRTTLAIALTPEARDQSQDDVIAGEGKAFEVTLVNNRKEWVVTQSELRIEENGKAFAPGNLRATNDNAKYKKMVEHWTAERYTLRYSGGMVPDVYHILIKGKGVFANVSSEKAKAKLRLVYEVAPVGLLVELAGGKAVHESMQPITSVLDVKIEDLDQRLGTCMGSSKEVDKYCQFMFGDSS
jgi:sedoheptulose-bisphosphatase